jgi:putative restriction endonuclease
MAKPKQERWTRDQVLRALSLYCVLPFGRLHKANPDVIALAQELGRTPDAVAFKLTNLASFDPQHKARGVGGMANASRLDREVWDEFYGHWDELAQAVPAPRERDGTVFPFEPPEGPTTSERLLRVRRGQHFFRRAVLAAYDDRCCITGISNPELLRASHILPWAESEVNRLNPSNGLCLNALHDAAFDRGLLTIDEDSRVRLSPMLESSMPREAYEAHFERYRHQTIRQPERFAPDPAFLRSHRERSGQQARSSRRRATDGLPIQEA